MKKIPQICLIGYAGLQEYPEDTVIPNYCYTCAEEIGRLIGQEKWYLVTGGASGIMESAARGAQQTGGTTISVICGQKRDDSNAYTDIEVVTNAYVTSSTPILIGMADIIIVCGGGAGTLQEIAIAYRLDKPIIMMNNTGGWVDKLAEDFLDERKKYPLIRAKNASECITICKELLKKKI